MPAPTRPNATTAAIPTPSSGSLPLRDLRHIPRRTAGQALSYEALRDEALEHSQALSHQWWTDYNHHDPGVTLLEALCYALTQGLFIAGLPVADLLTGDQGQIEYHRHGLHRPEEILPSRPTTKQDYHAYLLDQVPDLDQLRIQMAPMASANPDETRLSGLWRLALCGCVDHEQPDFSTTGKQDRTHSAPVALAKTLRAYWAQRNLCEDLDCEPLLLRARWCNLQADLVIEGAREVEDILAELIQRCDIWIRNRPQRRSLAQRLDLHESSHADAQNIPEYSEIFDGPLPRRGWIDLSEKAALGNDRVFFSDLARIAQQIEGIQEIRSLRLSDEHEDPAWTQTRTQTRIQTQEPERQESAFSETEPDNAGAISRQGQDWVLRLNWPEDLTAVKRLLKGVTVSRRGHPVAVSAGDLLRHLNDLRARRSVIDNLPISTAVTTLPVGVNVSDWDYFPAYAQLPPIYHGARDGLERLDTPTEAAAARAESAVEQAQLSAYMALLEQWIAHGEAQAQHLSALFSLSPQPKQSYWWQMLSNTQLPNLDELYTEPAAALCNRAFINTDPVLERRTRVIDFLLALHGESIGQNSLRAFGYYHSAEAWEKHLFEQKRQMLLRIRRQTRDRNGAIDYSRRVYGRRGNTSVLHERLALLLGFKDHHCRWLTEPLRTQAVRLREAPLDEQATVSQPPNTLHAIAMDGPARIRVDARFEADDRDMLGVLAHYFPAFAQRILSPTLLRCAVHADRYHHAPNDPQHPLWIGPDEHHRWWPLAIRAGLPNLNIPAMRLHQFARRLQLACEGVHLIEHPLLRPGASAGGIPPAASDDVPGHFYAHQLTAIFPAWTARGADPGFRFLARETLALNCPAHLLPHVLWLDIAQLQRFESHYQRWLAARQAQCAEMLKPQAQRNRTRAVALETESLMLRRLLWRWLCEQDDDRQ